MYLVTGGAGFIGSHIVAALVERGARVRVLDNLSSGRLDNLGDCREQVEFVHGDIREPGLAAAFRDVKIVLHQAAVASVERSVADPVESELNNVVGTLNVLRCAREAGAARVVIAGSAAAYGRTEVLPQAEDLPAAPLSPYAVTKYACEHYARAWPALYGLETVVLRYFNVFGPRQDPCSDYSGVISRFIDRMERGERPLIFGDGEQTRDFVYVANVAAANLLAAASPRVGRGEVINVGSGESISINRLVEAINIVIGADLAPVYGEARQGDVRHSRASLDRARALLGYEVKIDFYNGLRRVIEWHRGA